MLESLWRNETSHPLLIGWQIVTNFLENNLTLLGKLEISYLPFVLWPPWGLKLDPKYGSDIKTDNVTHTHIQENRQSYIIYIIRHFGRHKTDFPSCSKNNLSAHRNKTNLGILWGLGGGARVKVWTSQKRQRRKHQYFLISLLRKEQKEMRLKGRQHQNIKNWVRFHIILWSSHFPPLIYSKETLAHKLLDIHIRIFIMEIILLLVLYMLAKDKQINCSSIII